MTCRCWFSATLIEILAPFHVSSQRQLMPPAMPLALKRQLAEAEL
jgi:hypothetical protein